MTRARRSLHTLMISAIIVAAGGSRRMGFNKLLAPLGGVPVLRRALDAFHQCGVVGEIIVVASGEVADAVEAWRALLPRVVKIVPGGAERHLSVWAGLQAAHARAGIVAVHDGGRPLISPAQIERCARGAGEHGAVTSARRVTETLKRTDDSGRIIESVDRANVWIMETPQVFRRELLHRAYEKVLRDGLLVTDEVSAVQHLGEPVLVVENNTPNPKITFPPDLAAAEKWLA